jgi:anti-sigma-K factor RskA
MNPGVAVTGEPAGGVPQPTGAMVVVGTVGSQ